MLAVHPNSTELDFSFCPAAFSPTFLKLLLKKAKDVETVNLNNCYKTVNSSTCVVNVIDECVNLMTLRVNKWVKIWQENFNSFTFIACFKVTTYNRSTQSLPIMIKCIIPCYLWYFIYRWSFFLFITCCTTNENVASEPWYGMIIMMKHNTNYHSSFKIIAQ